MDITTEQAQKYIQELQALRRQRLDLVMSEGVQLDELLADMMNEIEALYVIYRAGVEHGFDSGRNSSKSNEVGKSLEDK